MLIESIFVLIDFFTSKFILQCNKYLYFIYRSISSESFFKTYPFSNNLNLFILNVFRIVINSEIVYLVINYNKFVKNIVRESNQIEWLIVVVCWNYKLRNCNLTFPDMAIMICKWFEKGLKIRGLTKVFEIRFNFLLDRISLFPQGIFSRAWTFPLHF